MDLVHIKSDLGLGHRMPMFDGALGMTWKVKFNAEDLKDSPAAFEAVRVMAWAPGVNAGNGASHVTTPPTEPVQTTPASG